VEQCFSLTAKQPQPAYKPLKQPAEQGERYTFVENFIMAASNLKHLPFFLHRVNTKTDI
jgi:hypothetical protein